MAAIELYVEDALAFHRKGKAADDGDAFRDLSNGHHKLNHLCSFIDCEPDYIVRKLREQIPLHPWRCAI